MNKEGPLREEGRMASEGKKAEREREREREREEKGEGRNIYSEAERVTELVDKINIS